MELGREKNRKNVEDDRLSSLPDDLIHKIISFISIRKAIETSVLSSRWRYIWTSLPYLNLSSYDYYFDDSTRNHFRPFFSEFLNHVLSHRSNQIQVSSIKLYYGSYDSDHIKQILSYAFAYNVPQLNIKCSRVEKFKFRVFPFSSDSLKHLTLSGDDDTQMSLRASTLELLSLTTLHLDYVTFYDENTSLFSKCVNLKNLVLTHCTMNRSEGFHICHPRLSNLVIRDCKGKHHIFAPELASLLYKGYYPSHFSTESLCMLEKVDFCIQNPKKEDAQEIFGLLQQLHSVKFLRLNLEAVELLSSSMELISHQPSPFANLKSLNIYPDNFRLEEKETISTELINYFLDSSPSAAFTLISREESRAVRITKWAQNNMAELRVLLEKEKANIESNKANMDQDNIEVENLRSQLWKQNQRHIRERMRQIESCWEDLSIKIKQGKEKTCRILSRLQDLEEVLTTLPALRRAEIQTSYSSLCAEANVVMKELMDWTKIQFDEKQNCLNDYFNEFAIALQPSS